MAVTAKCTADQLATELDITNGEALTYEVSFKGAQAIFSIVDQHGTIILSPADPPISAGHWRKRWPGKKGDAKAPDDLNHVFGMHFVGGATEYNYKVTRRDKNSHVIDTCKNCKYTSTAPDDSFFDPLRVFTF